MNDERVNIYSFFPDDPYRQFKRKRRKPEEPWCAPEHRKFARNMERGFRESHDGRKMTELGKEYILDPRPEIMQPKRTPIFLGLDQPSS